MKLRLTQRHLGVVLVTALAAILRLSTLGENSLWGDEINMVHFATGERPLELAFGNAILYVWLLHGAMAISAQDWWLRLPAALFSILTVPLLWWTGRRLLFPSVGLVAALVLATSALHVYHAQEVHSYAMFCFWSLGVFAIASSRTVDDRLGPRLAFAVFLAVGLYIHLFAVFVIANALCLELVSIWSSEGRVALRGAIIRWAQILGLVGMLALPLLVDWILPLGVELAKKAAGDEPEIAFFQRDSRVHVSPTLFLDAFRELALGRDGLDTGMDRLSLSVLSLLFCLGMVRLLRHHRTLGVCVAVWILLPLLPMALFSSISSLRFGVRRLIFLVPILALVVAVGLVSVSQWAGRRGGHHATGRLCLAILLAVATGPALAYHYASHESADYRRTAALLRELAGPEDLLVTWKAQHLAYYLDDPRLLDIRTDQARVRRTRDEHPRVWYVRPGAVLRRDRETELERWLEEGEGWEIPMGGGLSLSMRAGADVDRDIALAAQERLVHEAIEEKPGRWYLHQALSRIYSRQRRSGPAEAEAEEAKRLRSRWRLFLPG